MPKNLVIVESPTKAKTLSKFLGKDFRILSSFGHVRDLPKSKIGVDVEKNFEPQYEVPKDSKKTVQELKKAAKDAETVYFATDEDREGEAIAWHLFELLNPDPAHTKRITFHEITKEAIEEALQHPRDIDQNLVDAQQARRILDRLVGYELSPLLWKKIAYGLSAGRVQSVATRLIVEREIERMEFKPATFWDALAKLKKGSDGFEAKLSSVDGKRVATGKDFDETTGAVKKNKDVLLLGEKEVTALVSQLHKAAWTVQEVTEKPTTAYPSPPFITSTLQQEANRKLGLSSRDTMRVAQRLYEEGRITYMRTDSPNLSNQALSGARSAVESLYGKDYLSPEPRQYKAKSRGAQEAHEAIRPAGASFVHPKDAGLTGKELALYELIWKRTLATQMADAKKLSLNVQIAAANALFTATGSTIVFPGFLRVYVESSDDPEAALEDREVILPKLVAGDTLALEDLTSLSHTTKPPARYTDATLVRRLEQDGVGRPSTYASIIGTIIDRGYVRRMNNALVPTFTAFAVTQLLKRYFDHLVDVGFTSTMESALDEIAEGKRPWQPYLQEFYAGSEGFHQQITGREADIDPKASRRVELPHLSNVEVRVGKFGPYIVKAGRNGKTDEATHASIPESVAPADLTEKDVQEIIELQEKGPTPIGTHPETKDPIFVLTGRFGPYVQLGEIQDPKIKPRRASLPKGMNPNSVTVEDAVKFLSLPRTLGTHPDTGKDIVANNGRFGPYVVHEKDFRSLKKEDDVYTVTLERALALLAEEKRGRGGAKQLKDLGAHPKDGKAVAVYDGKYGPYVKHGRTNASLPKDTTAETITLEQAVALLAARKTKKKA